MHTTDFPSLRHVAKDVTVKAKVWGQIPVPVERIAENMRYTPMAFVPEGPFEGLAGAINHEQRVIYFNREDSAESQRFTIAHEIGHAVLHKGDNIVDFRMNIDDPRDLREVNANLFAAELLMPEAAFREVWASRAGNATRVAAYFGVSEQDAVLRAENLGLPRSY